MPIFLVSEFLQIKRTGFNSNINTEPIILNRVQTVSRDEWMEKHSTI